MYFVIILICLKPYSHNIYTNNKKCDTWILPINKQKTHEKLFKIHLCLYHWGITCSINFCPYYCRYCQFSLKWKAGIRRGKYSPLHNIWNHKVFTYQCNKSIYIVWSKTHIHTSLLSRKVLCGLARLVLLQLVNSSVISMSLTYYDSKPLWCSWQCTVVHKLHWLFI